MLDREHTRLAVAAAVEALRDELAPMTPGELRSVAAIATAVRMMPADDCCVSRAEALCIAADVLTRVGIDAAKQRIADLAAELGANRGDRS